MTKTPTLYVAGPMTGLPEYNYPAFFTAATVLEAAGFQTINPARREADPEWTWEMYLTEGLRDVLDCDGIALLDGWLASKGARLEVHVAEALGKPVQTLDAWLASVTPLAPS